MLSAGPGAHFLMGNGDSALLHHSAYDVIDAALSHGVRRWVGLVEARLGAAQFPEEASDSNEFRGCSLAKMPGEAQLCAGRKPYALLHEESV